MADRITLTNLNIRQSIFILIVKLVAVDVIAAVGIIASYFILIQGGEYTVSYVQNSNLFLFIFGILGIIKISFGIYIVLLWLNEYYEITPDSIVHKKGIIFRKSEKYDLGKVRMLEVNDTILGEYFNFATITLFDIRLQKYLDMYLVHNPNRYVSVIKAIRPQIETKEDSIRLPFKKTHTPSSSEL